MTESYFPTFAAVAKQVWYWSVIRGVVAIVFGVIAMLNPVSTALSLAIFIGIFAIIDGIVEIVDGIRHRGTAGANLRLAMGVVTLIVGLILVIWPITTTTVVVYLVAVWAIVIGLIQVFVSLGLRSVPGSGWGWGLLVGVVTVAFGLLVIAQPNAGLVTIMWIVGIYAVVIGLLLVALGFTVRSLGKTAAAMTARSGGGPVIIETPNQTRPSSPTAE